MHFPRIRSPPIIKARIKQNKASTPLELSNYRAQVGGKLGEIKETL